ncbi:MAG TPA: reductive dehalogenase domain-containing protein [Victivallales bacterium]|nr:reductive dehalogenase domain-containing protein [Victivallales bacterium]
MFEITEIDKPTYSIDKKIYRRFDQRNTAFSILRKYPEKFGGNNKVLFNNECHASDSLHDNKSFSKTLASTVETIKSQLLETNIASEKNSDFSINNQDILENTKNVKAAASLFSADKSGICKLNKNWIYSYSKEGTEIKLDDDMKYAVVLLSAMDSSAILEGTECDAQNATMIGYLKGSLCASSLALFIRNSGYKALCHDNNFALSIPLAIDAGLGEMSRNGMLVTPELGSLIRISKVITNMPLQIDKPITMGIKDFCSKCSKCSNNCPAGAIDSSKKQNYNHITPCSNEGVQRWQIDASKCLKQWLKINISCSRCLKVCPLNKILPKS